VTNRLCPLVAANAGTKFLKMETGATPVLPARRSSAARLYFAVDKNQQVTD
jgi:hypothetical protein